VVGKIASSAKAAAISCRPRKGPRHPNPVFQFQREDAFYTQAFDWSVDSNHPMNHGRIDTPGPLTPLPGAEMTAVLVGPQGIPQPPTLSKYHIRERMNASVWMA
jgi:hypothetical protein